MVRLNKTLFILLLINLLIIVSSENVESNTENPNAESDTKQTRSQDDTINPQTRELIREMGLDKPGKITKEVFTEFLFRLITKGDSSKQQDNTFTQTIVQKLVDRVPDEFESRDLEKYITPSLLTSVFEEAIKANYGEEIYQEIMKQNALKKKDL